MGEQLAKSMGIKYIETSVKTMANVNQFLLLFLHSLNFSLFLQTNVAVKDAAGKSLFKWSGY
jgi:hypothetical protein